MVYLQEYVMTKVAIAEEIAAQIRNGEGPIELVDPSGRTIGIVRRPPTQSEIDRARSRSSNCGQRLSWDQLVAKVKDEVSE
jgi:hypothetical protein